MQVLHIIGVGRASPWVKSLLYPHELLVVIAIIAILAACSASVGASQSAGQSAACKSNLRQIGIALSPLYRRFQKYPLAAAD